MNLHPFIEAIVEVLVFFGLSNDDLVDPDVAVSKLEQLASILRKLDFPAKQEFSRYVKEIASREEMEAGRTERVEFLDGMIENLGLL